MTAKWLAPVLGLGAVVLAGITPAQASCGVFSRPAVSVSDEVNAAKVVFVGRVFYTLDQDRSARVKVESIWRGPTLPAYVDVHGEAPGSGSFSGSEGDHRYQAGQQYLFFPANDQPPFQDYGDCNSSTRLYTAELAGYAPPDAKSPAPATTGDLIWNFVDQYSWPLAILAMLMVAAISILLFNLRRRAKLVR